MNTERHTIESPDGAPPAASDRVVLGLLVGVANAAGGGAGASVTTAVAIANLPASYSVQVTTNQDAVAYVTSKTQAGFNVVMNPRLAANTLAAGTFDVLVTA